MTLRACALAALLAGAPATAAEVPTPASVLGFEPGADRQVADWVQITDYFHRLDQASERVSVREVGRTTEGRPFLVAVITSEANQARLEELRQVNERLWDPRGLGEEEAADLVRRGRAVVAVNHGIHSTEVGSVLSGLQLAYWLAAGDTPEVRRILDQAVVVMLPSHNPDGAQTVAEWYRQGVGTPHEGGDPPFLYQRYAGHDNNRDWYMFTQVESRLTVEHLYRRWHPQVVHDVHQMGTRGPRLFLPPYLDPFEPNVDPALVAASGELGLHVASALTSRGLSGVVVHALYDAWTPSRAYPHTHGGVRLLSEAASARMATPVEVEAASLLPTPHYDPRRPSWNFPLPWPGGSWTLQDIVGYQLAASQAVLGQVAGHREEWLRRFLEVNRRAATRRAPYAFVVPAGQDDPHAAAALLEVLSLGEVEVQRARSAFSAGGRRHGAGSHVILMAQPASSFAKTVLERQEYPDRREYQGGPPERPYDVTAHTLPLLMGVRVVEVAEPFQARLERVEPGPPLPGKVEGKGAWLAFGHKTGDLTALGRLVSAGVPVRWALRPFEAGKRTFPAGTLLAPAAARATLAAMTGELGLRVRAVARPPAESLTLARPRVALYQSYLPSMDEGWTRFVLEKASVPFQTVHDADVRKGSLQQRYDVLVLPDENVEDMVKGRLPDGVPDEYAGGLGREGIVALREFVRAGGTLVALNRAAQLPVAEMDLGVSNALAGVDPSAFYCPGAILRVHAAGSDPLLHGYDEPGVAWFEEGPAFTLTRGRALLTYDAENPLLSGWLLGGERLQGKAALAEVPLGKGKVVLFGFRPQYRAQSWASYAPFLNALYLAAARPTR